MNQEETEKMRERVDKLRGTDSDYKNEDSVHILAEREDKFRDILKESGLSEENIQKPARIFSDTDLERIEAEKANWIDALTTLRNRGAYEKEIPQMLSMEKRQNADCSMLVIDFDHFKEVNDRYGHDAGDEALKKLAEQLQKIVRSSDLVYRYGGEEFVVFLPATISSRAMLVAKKILKAIEDLEIKIINSENK